MAMNNDFPLTPSNVLVTSGASVSVLSAGMGLLFLFAFPSAVFGSLIIMVLAFFFILGLISLAIGKILKISHSKTKVLTLGSKV